MAASGSKANAVAEKYPLHYHVFRNEIDKLKSFLEAKEDSGEIEKKDVYGRTPLMLATTLGHFECTKLLLEYGADADVQNREMWSVSNESVCTGNPDLVRLVIQHRDFQRNRRSVKAMNRLLSKLSDSEDFYAEMSWEFNSWIPFVSRMCPSDTYKIYKRGTEVRIDTTLVGFDGRSTWTRGDQSFVFRLLTCDMSSFTIIDHERKKALVQTADRTALTELDDFTPSDEAVFARLSSPVATTYVDVDRIGFERSKGGGIFSWITSSEKSETVDGYECKVFQASNVELVTKTRFDHLSEEDKQQYKKEESKSPLNSVLQLSGLQKRHYTSVSSTDSEGDVYGGMSAAEYLSGACLGHRDIGGTMEIARKSNTFNATLCLASPEYPLNLQEQVLPIIDLMAANNSHFARLKNFIQLQMPGGFPVRIDIPLLHVITAQVTFKNVNSPGHYVTPICHNRVSIDESAFNIPEGYAILDEAMVQPMLEPVAENQTRLSRQYMPSALQEEEMLLQYALEQSMLEQHGPGSSSHQTELDQYDTDLALAIQESLRATNGSLPQEPDTAASTLHNGIQESPETDGHLAEALRLSRLEDEIRQREMRNQEDTLKRVLELSKTEK
ncbi:hypothetical protein QR680_012976 [Steinernema hermaphroditum]|uniref:Ankyrin repeat domain-containing protein n=1 Tax=Steinernema hermaphroditum TaxID=289476 RepID=A0AA39M1R7_9BILA|nr:hypothetical protein QR680_012976 [Steinernema hermaphroditum]